MITIDCDKVTSTYAQQDVDDYKDYNHILKLQILLINISNTN